MLHNTEQLILEAAEAEFLAKGFAGARTTAIAEAAGVTHAMLHYYFRTKEKLFERIVNEKVALLRDALLAPLEDDGQKLEALLAGIIERHLDFLAANPLLPRFLLGELSTESGRSVLFLEKIHIYAPMLMASLQMRLDRAADAGECRRVDAHMLMLDIASLNVFPFMALPIVSAGLGEVMADLNAFVARRKRENLDTIMRKLKP